VAWLRAALEGVALAFPPLSAAGNASLLTRCGLSAGHERRMIAWTLGSAAE